MLTKRNGPSSGLITTAKEWETFKEQMIRRVLEETEAVATNQQTRLVMQESLRPISERVNSGGVVFYRMLDVSQPIQTGELELMASMDPADRVAHVVPSSHPRVAGYEFYKKLGGDLLVSIKAPGDEETYYNVQVANDDQVNKVLSLYSAQNDWVVYRYEDLF